MDAPVAEIIMIGSELLLGELQDTNATYLAQTLAELVTAGMLSQAEAEIAAGQILAGNARRLYGLD